jgi:hypothetical protein
VARVGVGLQYSQSVYRTKCLVCLSK